MTDDYLSRVRAAERRMSLKRQIAFGLAVSFVCILVGGYHHYLREGAHALWTVMTYAGYSLFVVVLVIPRILELPERLFHTIGNAAATLLLRVVLAVLYVVLFIPIRVLLRNRGRYQVTTWDTPPAAGSTWEAKGGIARAVAADNRRRSLLRLPLEVVLYFHQQRQFILVPVVIILVVCGLVLFFIQTSALAPFIYTLF